MAQGGSDTPFEVLNSATAINAEILGMEGKLGCISPGAFADLLVVDGDPLTDQSLLFEDSTGIHSVWKSGRPLASLAISSGVASSSQRNGDKASCRLLCFQKKWGQPGFGDRVDVAHSL
ncbi:hypothetical protein CDQ92_08250 [Sphingopyxis bauzanensis]|uniref:Amidohydrolase-related domain-containing protein n=1 Tax=Sphingopyxis bauzanensis TaxID=651663 RepID=A0A246JVG0_9SPHN|nr:amidohydrolase family protein [Sphingopyxis bauzanensis]OWQ97064.1 hypothetical protein CDQ92_08250 [Sphingopyxis bauzanensis]GGJ41292.1 hypothetical protein GCM10011393_09360 [Sphingopyxis bauzanensis]